MGDFNKQSFSSGRSKFSRGRDGGGFNKRRDFSDRSSRGPVEMHRAVCDNCGRDCEVPFRPTSGKPVYCSNCFEQKNGGLDSRRSEGRDFSRSNDREMFDAVCDNCGKDCKVPFRPTQGKPIFCSNCFEQKNEGGGGRPNSQPQQANMNGQFEALNKKLDTILGILQSAVTEEQVVENPILVEEPVEETPVVEKKKRASKKATEEESIPQE